MQRYLVFSESLSENVTHFSSFRACRPSWIALHWRFPVFYLPWTTFMAIYNLGSCHFCMLWCRKWFQIIRYPNKVLFIFWSVYKLRLLMLGASGSVVGWATMLQVGGSQVQFLMSLYFPIDQSLQPYYGLVVDSQLVTQMSSRNLPAGKERPGNRLRHVAAPTVLSAPAAGQRVGRTTEAPSQSAYQRDRRKLLTCQRELHWQDTAAITSRVLRKWSVLSVLITFYNVEHCDNNLYR
jgi:hypothetical protein